MDSGPLPTNPDKRHDHPPVRATRQVATQFARKGFPVRRTLGLRFRDVPEGHWASSAVHTLKDVGILTGYPDAKFRG